MLIARLSGFCPQSTVGILAFANACYEVGGICMKFLWPEIVCVFFFSFSFFGGWRIQERWKQTGNVDLQIKRYKYDISYNRNLHIYNWLIEQNVQFNMDKPRETPRELGK